MRCPNIRIILTPGGQRFEYKCRGTVGMNKFMGAPMCSGCLNRVLTTCKEARAKRYNT